MQKFRLAGIFFRISFGNCISCVFSAMNFFSCNFNNRTFEENVQLPLVLVANDTQIRLYGSLPGLSDMKRRDYGKSTKEQLSHKDLAIRNYTNATKIES